MEGIYASEVREQVVNWKVGGFHEDKLEKARVWASVGY